MTKKGTKRLLWAVFGVALAPLVLVLLLFVALYFPPIQKWAVDLAAEELSESTGWKVSVDRVLLKFPLDVSLGGVNVNSPSDGFSATDFQGTDTDAPQFHVSELLLTVKPLPLLSGELQVEKLRLSDTDLNTAGLVESMQMRGHVGELRTNDVSMLLDRGDAVVPELWLKNSNIIISIPDSVPETEEDDEPGFLRSMQLKKVHLDDVAFSLLTSSNLTTHLDKASLSSVLDIEGGNYFVKDLQVLSENQENGGSLFRMSGEDMRKVGVTLSADSTASSVISRGFNPDNMYFSNIHLLADSVSYLSSGDLYVGIQSLTANERGGLSVEQSSGVFRMDSTSIYLDDFRVKTPESDLSVGMKMNLNAFDDENPGVFELNAEGTVSKNDIMQFTSDFTDSFSSSWPDRPLAIDAAVSGNMQSLSIDHLVAGMPGMFNLSASGNVTDITSPDNMGMNLNIDADGNNLSFVKQFLPPSSRSSFNLPPGMKLKGTFAMMDGLLKTNATVTAGKSSARIVADYDMDTETYLVDLDARNFNINQFVPLSEQATITGRVYAKGRGFNFDSPHTYADAKVNLDRASYGSYYLTNTDAVGSLKNHRLGLVMDTDDSRLQAHLTLDGTMTGRGVNADAVLDLPYADVMALGFSADPLTATATHGTFSASSNFGDLFLVDMTVQGVQIAMNEKDSLVTDLFDLYAETTADTTAITARTGDFYFDLHSPNNLFSLIDRYAAVEKATQRQLEKRALNFDALKLMMPEAVLHADIGRDNPISKYLALRGYGYDEIVANVRTSHEYGIQGDGHVYAFTSDSVNVDTIYFDLQQDSTLITLNAGVTCSDQELFPAFSANVNGYVSPNDADLRLNFFDGKGRKGVDLGLRGVIGEDSVLHLQMYPEEPIIAYKTFRVNPDNYIDIHRRNRIFADIRLESTSDSCSVAIYANPDESQMQNINAVINNLDLRQLLTVVPFAPRMTGNLALNANYIQTEENYSANGTVMADDFTFEGIPMGDLMSYVYYHPTGDAGHDIQAMVFQNDNPIAMVKGTYNADGNDELNVQVLLEGLPASIADPFMPEQLCAFNGLIDGEINIAGKTDALRINGKLLPNGVHVYSDVYSFNLGIGDEPISIADSRLTFNALKIYGAHGNPLTMNGYTDFSDFSDIQMNLSLYGNNFAVFDTQRTRKSALFGTLYGDFFTRITGTTNDLKIRGMINVLKSTNITYIMTNTPLSVDYRLGDIVTFVDFSQPSDSTQRTPRTFTGIDMQITLEVEEGSHVVCEFSADRQSYVNVQGGGTIRMNYTPDGVLSLQGRYTVNEGEMKYTLPVIPLKTFTIKKGSYIEFAGPASNPILNIEATEATKASVSNEDGSSRSVLFNTGLRITNTLSNMGLEFTIDAPEDIAIQNELAGMTAEEKNKLSVALLATGMYLSTNNSSGFSASNALNQFLQREINNIAGRAVSSAVDVDMTVGLEQSRRDDGTTRTDYSFKFNKRFFSDRLNVIIGGKVRASDNSDNREAGAYIDDISLEWRLDNGGTQYIRLFHGKNYDNLVEGEITENGAGVVLRKKVDRLSELLIWKNK